VSVSPLRRSAGGRLARAAWFGGMLSLGACTPSIANDPVPGAMQWDPAPPRVPSPTGLIVDPTTGLIDFGLAGIDVPSNCRTPGSLSEAQCELDQYLEALDGYPSVTPAAAPASVPLDPATLTLGDNIVAVTGSGAPLGGVSVAFDDATGFLTVAPAPSWDLGATVWLAVRGYDAGVRATSGAEVVGSPTLSLLKQESPLTCGAADPAQLDASCPAYDLLAGEGQSHADVVATLVKLEAARLSYLAAGAWDLVAAAGIGKSDVAALWGFPVHTSSVAELAPPALVPRVAGPSEIDVAVHGTVDPATVVPFVTRQQSGPIVVMDLTAVAAGDLVAGLPVVDARYTGGAVAITGAAPFVVGHAIGLFFTNGLHDAAGRPLVASPVSAMLTFEGALLDAGGHSTVGGVSDADAAMLEAGRSQLTALFQNPSLTALTGISRGNLIYCYAFTFGGGP
jgi:hypothetical protein